MVLVSLASVTYLWWGWWRAEGSIAELHGAVAEHEAELAKWRESARSSLEGLGAAIDAQFARWGLTGAEREVALLAAAGTRPQAGGGADGAERAHGAAARGGGLSEVGAPGARRARGVLPRGSRAAGGARAR